MIIDPSLPPPNRSNAVINKRIEPHDSLDDFPTQPWGTRALMEYVIGGGAWQRVCLEPACGRGYMSEPLKEYFQTVISTDIHDYGYGGVANFLEYEDTEICDFCITNPPFKLAEEFIDKALKVSRLGVAMLTRSNFIESIGRYNNIFSVNAPHIVAQFSERLPLVKGRIDRKASTATSYSWLVWFKGRKLRGSSTLIWIPPCRKELERDNDYV
jgi:hypothetical protein